MNAGNTPTNYSNARIAASKPKSTRGSITDAIIKAAVPNWTTFSRQHPLAADLITQGADYYARKCSQEERRTAERSAGNLSRWREATTRGAERVTRQNELISGFLNWPLPNGVRARDATIDDWEYAREVFTRNINGNQRRLKIVNEAINFLIRNKADTFGDLVESGADVKSFDRMIGELRT